LLPGKSIGLSSISAVAGRNGKLGPDGANALSRFPLVGPPHRASISAYVVPMGISNTPSPNQATK